MSTNQISNAATVGVHQHGAGAVALAQGTAFTF